MAPRLNPWATRAAVLGAVATLIAALGGLYFNAQVSKQATEQARQTLAAQTSERFSRSVDQLGSADVAVRMGAVYSFGQLLRDDPPDTRAIVEILSSFIVMQLARAPRSHPAETTRLPADIRAALRVLGQHREPMFLQGADFSALDLRNVPFRGADLREADFTDALLIGEDFSGSNLSAATLSDTNLDDARFDGARLEGTVLYRAELLGTDLSSAHLRYADFSGATFGGAQLPDDLGASRFSGAYLHGMDLHDADLTGVDLTRAHLTRADLQSATLRKAILRRTDFSGANLRGADLREAAIAGTKFDHADLRGANLIGADLTTAPPGTGAPSFDGVTCSPATRWPTTMHDVPRCTGQ